MVILFVTISLLIILFYGTIFFTEQTRTENKKDKTKMEYYNRINIKGTPFIQDFKTTSKN